MITNPQRLYQDCPPGAPHYYRLRLVDHYIVKPLGRLYELTISGALRQQVEQANLLYADGTKVPEEDKAKGTSQHTLGEVADLDGPQSEVDSGHTASADVTCGTGAMSVQGLFQKNIRN